MCNKPGSGCNPLPGLTQVLTSLLCLFQATQLSAQLSGIKSIPGDYATVAAAVTALNGAGVGAGA